MEIPLFISNSAYKGWEGSQKQVLGTMV